MKPIDFHCTQLMAHSPADICAAIADTARWSGFGGYGPLPGIRSAVYAERTDGMVGSRIRVENSDGSRHVEEIYQWLPGQAVGMKLHEFSPPLSYLATHFTEDWTFRAEAGQTAVTRTLRLFPRHALARPLLWLISLLFRRAIARHLADMAAMR